MLRHCICIMSNLEKTKWRVVMEKATKNICTKTTKTRKLPYRFFALFKIYKFLLLPVTAL